MAQRGRRYPIDQRGKGESERSFLDRLARRELIAQAPAHREIRDGREYVVRVLPTTHRWPP